MGQAKLRVVMKRQRELGGARGGAASATERKQRCTGEREIPPMEYHLVLLVGLLAWALAGAMGGPPTPPLQGPLVEWEREGGGRGEQTRRLSG